MSSSQQLLLGEGAVNVIPNFIEEVFSTYLYTGTGATQTITNNIDLSTKGGLVWIKSRSAAWENKLTDTVRGVTKGLISNSTGAETTDTTGLTTFNTTGFTLGSSPDYNWSGGSTYVSWTFREQPKFFDIVTYTGTGAVQNIAHNLGSVPGCIIIKAFAGTSSGTRYWAVYHRSNGETKYQELNSTNSAFTNANYWDNTAPTSTQFTIGSAADLNASGNTFVAYLFAHDAGGFGTAGTDNVISCGSYTGNGVTDGPSINLGYEAQYVLIKRADAASNWHCQDIMRGMSQTDTSLLFPNLSNNENTGSLWVSATSTGFKINTGSSGFNASGGTYIYIAIRRGPMEVPTLGTSVFTPSTRAGTGAVATTSNLSFPPDMVWSKGRDNGGTNSGDFDRLRGATKQLSLNQSDAETTASTSLTGFDVMTGYTAGADAVQLTINATGYNYVNWQFKRAPGFFDEVCYTGTGTSATQTHNLGVTPEWVICKSRTSATYPNWALWSAGDGIVNHDISGLSLNLPAGATYIDLGFSSRFTATTFQPDTVYDTGGNGKNQTSNTYVAYLFATCAGVSKVGYYVGTGTTKQIDCGFTAGARFVLIKRVDSTGDWYVWDSARGIIAGNDPYLLLNSTAIEVTSTDYIDTYSAGFEISSTAPAAINANNGKFIFLAIA